MAEVHSITTAEGNAPQRDRLQEAKTPVIPLDIDGEIAVLDSLRLIRAVGDSLVSIGTAYEEVPPPPSTFLALGYLLIDRIERCAGALGVSSL
jgi:hypothetical protein